MIFYEVLLALVSNMKKLGQFLNGPKIQLKKLYKRVMLLPKKWSTLYIRKSKLKQQWDTTTRLLEWPKSKYWQPKMLTRMWSNRNSHSWPVGMQMVQPLWKTAGRFPTNWTCSHHIPAIMLLAIYPKELRAYVHTQTCTQIYIAALLITAKAWE